MPVFKKPQQNEMINLPLRKGLIAGETDVLIVGGGPAGIGAALGASALGVKVTLVERYGFLGGNATAALVMPLMSFYTQQYIPPIMGDASSLLPQDHGRGRPVIAGALKLFLEKLIHAGGAIPPSLKTGYTVPFDPEIFKITALDMLEEANVNFLFHAFASDVIETKDLIKSVIFETKMGPIVIHAKIIVDCSGDGDVAARAHVPFDVGREEDHLVQPMTLMFRMGEFCKKSFEEYVKQHPNEWHSVCGLWDLVRQATEKKELSLARENILFFATPHEKEVSVNSTRVTHVLGIDVWDLTYAEWESRKQMKQIVAFLKKYVPGFEKSYAIQSGANVGVRETRRIRGEYQMTVEDILNAKKFPDAIAKSTYPVDIHSPSGKGTLLKKVPENDYYEIPLRSLCPQSMNNLLVAGRCISGTHEALSSYRVMPVSMATGQAAGVCGSLAIKLNKAVKDVPAEEVRKELMRQGADI